TSSSHALVGGFAGAAMAHAGPGSLIWPTLLKVSIFILGGPPLGFLIGLLFMPIPYLLCRTSLPSRVGSLFKRLQLVSAAAYSLGHGGHDAQKTMGTILAVLTASKELPVSASVPLWVVLSCHAAMALGTMAGGW